ncbi:MAG TPA: amidohydrolase/deacetylase family metallohydrolase [Acidimicrobiales bacterium]|jgi:dihydroorotase
MTELPTVPLDLVVRGGRVVDPATGADGLLDVGVAGDRIAAVGPRLPVGATTTVIDATGQIVTAGLVDLHTHVFAHATGFGVDVDDAGVNAGVTTAVDMGSTGTWWFPTLKAYVIDRAVTDVVAFLMMGYVGATWRVGGPPILNPDWADPESLAAMHEHFPDHVRGFKTWGESGSTSQWGWRFLHMGRKAGDLTGLPIYIHTGELYPVDEANRPDPATIMPEVLATARPGDVLGHCYSAMPDGILGRAERPSQALADAVERGVRLDVGHGINFSFAVARRMLAGGLAPYTISSDTHALLSGMHDDSTCSYSLVGTMSKLLALGMSLTDVVRCTTEHPATVLGMADEIGSLRVGSRADLTLLEPRREPWTFLDPVGGTLDANERLVPSVVIRAGRPLVPSRRLLRDVCEPEERGEAGLAVAVGGLAR